MIASEPGRATLVLRNAYAYVRATLTSDDKIRLYGREWTPPPALRKRIAAYRDDGGPDRIWLLGHAYEKFHRWRLVKRDGQNEVSSPVSLPAGVSPPEGSKPQTLAELKVIGAPLQAWSD